MNTSNPFFRSFVVGAIWFVGVALKMVSRHPGPLSTFSPKQLIGIAIAWLITASLLGNASTRFEGLRTWPAICLGTVVGWFGVMGLMYAAAPMLRNQPTPPKFANTDEMMVYLAKEAEKWVKEDKGIALDYSIGSVTIIEEQLSQLSKKIDRANPPKGTFGQAMGYAAYIGETVRRKHGGSWGVDHPSGGAGSYPLMTMDKRVLFPVTWCWKRVINGEEDNVVHKLTFMLSPDLVSTNGVISITDGEAKPPSNPK